MDLSTRLATADDRSAVWALYVDAMKGHISAIWGWDEQWQVADFDQAWTNAVTHVMEVEGAIAGYVQLEAHADATYLRMLIVAPHIRSMGIGARQLAQLERDCRASAHPLKLRVFRVNEAAHRFYLREGWAVESEDEVAFMMCKQLTEMDQV